MHDTARIRTVRIGFQWRVAAACRAGRHMLLPVLLLVGLSAAPAVAEDLPDTPANRQLAAQAYLKIYPLEVMIGDTTEAILKALPPESHEAFLETMKQVMEKLDLEQLTVNSVASHFTLKEINAMSDFYGSAEGQSIMKKYPAYMTEISQKTAIIIAESIKAVQEKMQNQ